MAIVTSQEDADDDRTPPLSFLALSYKPREYLMAAVESIKDQFVAGDGEVNIQDGASTDGFLDGEFRLAHSRTMVDWVHAISAAGAYLAGIVTHPMRHSKTYSVVRTKLRRPVRRNRASTP